MESSIEYNNVIYLSSHCILVTFPSTENAEVNAEVNKIISSLFWSLSSMEDIDIK